MKELDKARREIDKTKAEAEKAKKESEKVKKEAKKKLSDKGAAPPEPAGVSTTLEGKTPKNEQLYKLKNENEVSVYYHVTKLMRSDILLAYKYLNACRPSFFKLSHFMQ